MKRVLTSRIASMKLATLVAAVLALSLIAPAQATVYTVDDGGGGDHLTIAAAILAASNGDTIDILSDITEHSILVNKSLTITGQGADVTTVQNITAGMRIFTLNAVGITVTFQDFKLTGGDPTGSFASGGAIDVGRRKMNGGVLTINRMAFVDNNAEDGGGAVAMDDHDGDSTIIITNSTFSGNEVTDGSGGAVRIGNVNTATIRNSTFSGNTANTDSNHNNFGGAVYMYVTGDTPVGLVQNSTFVDNSMLTFGAATGTGGAAIYGTKIVSVESSVFAGNVTVGTDVVRLTASFGGDPNGTVSYSLSEGDLFGTYAVEGVGNTENLGLLGVGYVGLDVLADNGGTTLTHALLTSLVPLDGGGFGASPAIDAGSNPAGVGVNPYDQRGSPYARSVGTTDMGAFEVPEPATMALLGIGGVLLVARRRRRTT